MDEYSDRELTQLVWDHLGVRIGPHASKGDKLKLLCFDLEEEDISEPNPYNVMRDNIMGFIEEHKRMLALPCLGNCYDHCDMIVLNCHNQLVGRDGDNDNE